MVALTLQDCCHINSEFYDQLMSKIHGASIYSVAYMYTLLEIRESQTLCLFSLRDLNKHDFVLCLQYKHMQAAVKIFPQILYVK